MRVLCAIAVSLGLLAGRAAAQPSLTTPNLTPPSATPRSRELPPRDPARARVMSLGIPLVFMIGATAIASGSDGDGGGIALPLFLGGAIVGPSAGIWYAGHSGGKGMLARGAAVSVFAMGIGSMIAGSTHDGCSSDECEARDRHSEQAAVVLMTAGAVGWTASWIYDIREAGRIVERRNAGRGAIVVPAIMSSASGDRVPGAVVAGTF